MTIKDRKLIDACSVHMFRLGFAVTLLFGSASAQALQPVNPGDGCGQALPKATDNGTREYVLTGDLVCPDTGGDINGITITANNVVFHLAGHTISSAVCDLTRNISGIFVQGGISGVRVDGGKVSGFNDGIVLSSSNSAVVGMTVTNACLFGIAGQGHSNRIERNVVTASGDGVTLAPAQNTRVASNDLSGNARGVVISAAGADNNIVEDNIINGNTERGISLANGTGNVVRNNTLNNNATGISIDTPGSIVRGNTVNGSSNTGIGISPAGAPSTVRRNTVLGSAVTDMSDNNAGCGGNIWGTPFLQRNTFQIDQVASMSDGGPGVGCIQ